MKFRPLVREDQDALARIITDIYQEFAYSEEIQARAKENAQHLYASYQLQERCVYWVIENDGEILGGGGLQDFNAVLPGYAELQKLYLKPETRGQGLGRKLVQQLINDARSFGYKAIYLESIETMDAAIKLYSKEAFKFRDAPVGYSCPEGCNVFMELLLYPHDKET